MTYSHTVLIVDDEPMVGKALGRLVKQLGIPSVYVDSGQAGLDQIKKASLPFSLIISDQRMPGMEGSEFLEKAKALSPHTLRFLLTGYADVNAVTRAVNRGAIHQYIGKPWDTQALGELLKAGLEQFELAMEKERLFKLAKTQNARLFALTKELKNSAMAHHNAIAQMDKEIDQLKKRLETGPEKHNHIQEISLLLTQSNMMEKDKINTLYTAIISELWVQFQGIANENGIDMPPSLSEGSDAQNRE